MALQPRDGGVDIGRRGGLGARDARDRDVVDEARGVRDDLGQACVVGGRRCEPDEVHPGVACGQAELDILFRREINDDQPVDAGVHGVGKEAIDAVDVDGVVVAHENDRSLVVSGPEATNHVERAVEARAARLGPQTRGLDGRAVGHGIGIHDAQLD